MLKLHFIESGVDDYQLKPGRNNIGRDKTNDLVLEDDLVSGFHANIFCEEEKIFIVDLGSKNGTRVNNRAISGRVELKAWNKIGIGATQIELIDSEARRPTSVQPIIQDQNGSPTTSFSADGNTSTPLAILEPKAGDNGNKIEIFNRIRVGRSEENDLVLRRETISGRHAEIIFTGTRMEVVDLDSTNGTFVNGVRVSRRELKSGDRLRFDETEFNFLLARAESAKTKFNPVIPEVTNKTSINPAIFQTSTTDTHQSISSTPQNITPAAKSESFRMERKMDNAAKVGSLPKELSTGKKVNNSIGSSPPEEVSSNKEISSAKQQSPIVKDNKMAEFGSPQISDSLQQTSGSGFGWLFFSLNGRLPRLNFVLATIGLMIFSWALMFALHGILFGSFTMVVGSTQYFTCSLAVSAILIYPYATLVVKRFHDQNRSGHFYWLIYVPIVNIVMFIMLLCFSGTKGQNRFGLPPA